MKKVKFFGIFVTFLLSILSHFLYNWFPNTFFSILFPVNESIWEHMKLIVTPTILFALLEYFIYKRGSISFNNFWFSYGTSTILGIVIYLIIYLPIYYIFGHNAFIAILLLFIIFVIIEIISYYIMNYRDIKYSLPIGISLIVLTDLLFGYLTYNPIENDLFFDKLEQSYGIQKKRI